MSTSEQNYGEDSAARLTQRLPVDENSIGQAASLPDVTMLTRMANDFFRAQPASAFPASAAPSVPDASYAGSDFETRLPQLGMPLPSVPAIPSAGKPGMPGTSSGITELSSFAPGQLIAVAPTELSSRPERSVVEGPAVSSIPGAAFPASPFSLPLPEFDDALFPSFSAGVPALPPLSP